MKLIPLSSIQISSNRQRREFSPDALVELRESIEDLGLFHPLVIRETPDGPILVAGERRLRALTEMAQLGIPLFYNNELIPAGLAPTVSLGELSPLEAEAAELDENIRRQDLSWQERAAAIARLHALRVRQAEAGGLPPQSIAATAEEVHGRADGDYHADIRRSVIVAKHLDNAAVAKAKSIDDAYKILKREESTARNVELAASVGATLTRHSHTAHNADAIEWMATQPSGQFDVILTDPPFGMDAHEFGDGAGRFIGIDHQYNDTYDHWLALMTTFSYESFRLAKPLAHLYLFCDIDRFHELREMFQLAGWWVHRTPIINYKPDGNRVPWPEHGPRRQWEMLLYAVKGKRPTLTIQPDVIETRMKEQTYGHGAQKPVALYQDLLKRSCRPGDRVFDPFAGTGTIFPAAHELKLIATGIEQDPAYYGICLKRLEELA